jgi:hypothetical protein
MHMFINEQGYAHVYVFMYINLCIYIYPGIGIGCKDLKFCSGNGVCDYCLEQCHCNDGFGSPTDVVTTGRDLDGTCSPKVCPKGKAIVDVPTASNKAHALAECSNKVYTYLYMYIHVYVYEYLCTYIYVYLFTYLSIYIYMHIYIYIYTYMYICICIGFL